MDPTRKVRMEQILVVVLLVVFVLALKVMLGNFGASHKATPAQKPRATSSAQAHQKDLLAQFAEPPPAATANAESTNGAATPGAGAEYTAESFRDPFISLLPAEPARPTGLASAAKSAPVTQPPPVVVQGLIWGGAQPQAVIDGETFKVGDTVKGARITAIDRRGVTIELEGETFQLTTAGPQQELAGRQRQDVYSY